MTTPLPNTSAEAPAEVRAQAAAWIARLHGPERSAATERGFRQWLEADPRHAQVFERMTEIWNSVGDSSAGRFPRVKIWQRRAAPARLALAAMALIVCAVAGIAGYGVLRDPAYTTAVGEQRTVDLDDGSHMTLNSDSRIVVAYREGMRRVQLVRGEAIFDVAADELRPFVVVAGDHEVRALGTVFVVRQHPDTTAVTLLEGKVAIASIAAGGEKIGASSPPSHSGQREDVITLAPGERFTISATRTQRLDTPALDAVTAWRRGEVILNRTPLVEAVAEMNRYGEPAIVIDDSDVAAIRVSGNYKTGDAEGFARAIANMYALEMVASEGKIHLRPSHNRGSQ